MFIETRRVHVVKEKMILIVMVLSFAAGLTGFSQQANGERAKKPGLLGAWYRQADLPKKG